MKNVADYVLGKAEAKPGFRTTIPYHNGWGMGKMHVYAYSHPTNWWVVSTDDTPPRTFYDRDEAIKYIKALLDGDIW